MQVKVIYQLKTTMVYSLNYCKVQNEDFDTNKNIKMSNKSYVVKLCSVEFSHHHLMGGLVSRWNITVSINNVNEK